MFAFFFPSFIVNWTIEMLWGFMKYCTLFTQGFITGKSDSNYKFRLPTAFRWFIQNGKKTHPWVPWYVQYINHPPLPLQDLALHGCFPVHVSMFFCVPDTYYSFRKGLDPVRTTFTVRQYKSHWKVGSPEKIKQLLAKHEALLAKRDSRQ